MEEETVEVGKEGVARRTAGVFEGKEEEEKRVCRRKRITTEEYFASEVERHKRYLLEYHVQLCSCSSPDCLHAHSPSEQRRPPALLSSSKWNYFPHKCKQGLSCSKLVCSKAHNDDEVKYHPTVYKTKRCSFELSEAGICTGLGMHCPFAHSEDDLRTGFRPQEDNGEDSSEGQASPPKRQASLRTNGVPVRPSLSLMKIQLLNEIAKLKRVLACASCGEFEKEWLLDCGHMVCSLCCNGRLRTCPSCSSEVRKLRAVRLK